MRRVDHETNYPEDAAIFERWRAEEDDNFYSDRPTKAELDRDEATS